MLQPCQIRNSRLNACVGVSILILLGLAGCNAGGGSASPTQGSSPADPPSLGISSSSPLPSGQVGVAYQFGFAATGGSAPYSWAITGGSPPPGLSLSAGSGALSGTPTQSGTSSFSVQVQDSQGKTVQGSFSLAIVPPLAVTTNSLAQEVVGVYYSASLNATGGTPPYTWQVNSGQLPSGLGLASAGTVSGTPSAAEAATVEFVVTDSSSPARTGRGHLSFNIVKPLTIVSASLPNGALNNAYSAILTAAGGTAPYFWTSTNTLPPGLTLGPYGQLSGAPTKGGQYSFTATVSDSSSITQSASASYAITVTSPASPITIQTIALPGGTTGVSYSANLQAAGGISPYSWSLRSGQLPPGLGLSTSGQISGAPGASGQYSFTVTASDSSSPPQTVSGSFVIGVMSPLTITSASLPSGTVNSAYGGGLTASGGATPYAWSLFSGALPAGLALAPNGQISGMPTSAGQSSFTVKVVDSSSSPQSVSGSFTITVTSSLASLVIQTNALPGGTIGVSYSASLQAGGGTAPYAWSLASGQLPAGLNLSASGQISGTPSAAGPYAFTIKVQDSSPTPQAVSASLSITVAAAPLAVTTTSLAGATAEISYSATLQATGGTTPYTWSIASGQLPPGLGLATDGQISGAPSASGTFSFTVKVQDSSSTPQSATASLSIAVAPAPLSVTTTTLASATAGVSYSAALQASGGTTPYSWTLASGQLPPGLNLAASGQISGTPSASGAYSFTAKVTDSSSTVESAWASLSMTVAPPPLTITTSSLPAASVGASYSASLQASGGTQPYSWTLTSGQLPAGMSMAAGGQISGTPSAGGQYNLTFKVQDSSAPPQTASVSLSITVAAPGFSIMTTSLPGGTLGITYSATLQASGGTSPYNWTLASGQLPAGLSLAAGGQISGAPTAAGNSSFTLQATDSSSPAQTATAVLTIAVSAPALGAIPASINFGNVTIGTPATQSIKLANSAGTTITISQATVAGSAFSLSGLTVPLSLPAGQSTYFTVQFSPTAAGSVIGNVSIVSNDPASPTSIPISGTSHWVTVSWTASTSTVVGYYVYRSTQSGGSYTQLNSTPVAATTYNDTSVTPGQTYYYVVTAVDSSNVQSVYSNEVGATVPTP